MHGYQRRQQWTPSANAMCQLCESDRTTQPRSGICSRCGHEGTCWVLEHKGPTPWPPWRLERICYRCIAEAVLHAAA